MYFYDAPGAGITVVEYMRDSAFTSVVDTRPSSGHRQMRMYLHDPPLCFSLLCACSCLLHVSPQKTRHLVYIHHPQIMAIKGPPDVVPDAHYLTMCVPLKPSRVFCQKAVLTRTQCTAQSATITTRSSATGTSQRHLQLYAGPQERSHLPR